MTLFTPESVRIGSPFMSGDRPQTRHKISPCARWDGETNTDTSPSTGEYTGAKRGDDWEGTEKGGEKERERREKIERTEVPFAEAGAKSPLTPLRSTRLNKCIGAKKKKEKGKRAPHPPFDHYRRNWESIGHERMGSSALLLASSALSSPSAPSSPRRATIIRLSPTARWKKKRGENPHRFDKLRRNTPRQSVPHHRQRAFETALSNRSIKRRRRAYVLSFSFYRGERCRLLATKERKTVSLKRRKRLDSTSRNEIES